MSRRLVRPAAAVKAKYGASPLHLLLFVLAGVVAGYAVLHWLQAPTPVRLLVWFGAAVIGHDLIAFPIYTGLDHLLVRAIAGGDPGPVISRWRRAAINHVRAPTIASILLLIMWYPLILKRSDAVYYRASGQHQDRGLGNWLLVAGVLFAVSLVVFLGRVTYVAVRSPGAAPRAEPPPPSKALPDASGTAPL